tara:strand:+ start:484 stop:696 length:213 start_codon:yes stop_codon:yes gene_type:complete
MPTAKEKKEDVKARLRKLRAELRIMHASVTEELKLPENTEITTIMKDMEELLLILEPKSAKKARSKAKKK